MKTLLYIFLGGGLGSIARYLVTKTSHGYFGQAYPIGTLLANFLASLLLGYLVVKSFNSAHIWQPLLVIGFCGGFSTFSTFSNDTMKLLQTAQYGTAMLHIGLNLFVCLAAIWLGMLVAK